MKKMRYNRTLSAAFGMALIALLAGCNKSVIPGNNDGDGLPMTIQPEVVSTDGALKSNDGGATKATLINEAAGLRTQGFGLSLYDGTTALKSKVEMEYKSGAWVPKGGTMDWKWPAGRTFSFYAWSPASLNVGTVTSTGVPAFTYSGIADQKDIMLGTYTGTGNNGAAPIKFYHPLASIQFKTGKMTNLKTLNKIELEGVITSGTCTPTMSGSSTTFAWSALGTTTTTLSQTGLSVASTTPGTAIGKSESDSYFLVLPQSAPLIVKITDSDNKVITAAIAAPALAAGHTAVYTIDYDGLHVTLSVSIKDWGDGQSEAVPVEEHILPDEEYWVNLGMVSENGYPLYISKRDVKSINGNIATFTDSETEIGGQLLLSDVPDVLYDQNGLKCRPIYSSELISLMLADNSTVSPNSNSVTVTSLINGESIVLVGKYIGKGVVRNDERNAELDIVTNNLRVGDYPLGKTRLVYEDLLAIQQAFADNYNVCLLGDPYSVAVPISSVTYSISKGGSTGTAVMSSRCTILTVVKSSNGYTGVYQTVPNSFEWTLTDSSTGGVSSNYALEGSTIKLLGSTYNPAAKITIVHNGKSFYFNFSKYKPCFVKGTVMTLADGSRKKVEDLTYDDELLVWNFDEGSYGSAKLLWMSKELDSTNYFKVTLSDGTTIKLVGSDGNCHRLFNYTDKVFQYPTKMKIGTEIYTENGIVTLVSCEHIEGDVQYYNLITNRHINCFADGILTSCRYNNLYPIDNEMKFVRDGRMKRPYKEFKAAGISREWYNGLRLGEQTDSLANITKYINDRVAIQQTKPAPSLWQKLKTWWKSIFG